MSEPVRRKKNIEDGGSGVHKRGDGLGTGPVGSSNGYSGKTTGGGGGSTGGPTRNGGRSPLSIIIIIAVILLGGGGGLGGLFGDFGGSEDTYTQTQTTTTGNDTTISQNTTTTNSDNAGVSTQTSGSAGMGSLLGTFLGGGSGYYGSASSQWSMDPNTGILNENVADGIRNRYTDINGDGTDTTTIMVYMCGTDLESRSAMATKDLQEMMAADLSDRINIIVYTGGCKNWQNNVISSTTNQIYKVEKGGLKRLEGDLGAKAMTDPDVLSGFIKWTAEKYPADRYDLIFWDHGGGSLSGYGYDEKFARQGSMGLSGIDKALKDGGIKYDFIGFDACLMATVENALVVSNYADYLIASEETEPGVGWYYTQWLNEYSQNPSMDTLHIGKSIIDSYTDECERTCRGQKTTLSLIDLAELEKTVPDELKQFATTTTEMISQKEYKTVSNARSQTREFASSSKIDQVDLIHFASNMGTAQGEELANTLKSCIKYNKTSSAMTNAYGLSIYFPYKKTGNVDSMVSTYNAIGMDKSYTDCIQSFASMEVAGQMAAGGTTTPAESIFGEMTGSSSASSADVLMQLFGSMLTSGVSGISGLDASNTAFLGKGLDVEAAADYISNNSFNKENLMWVENSQGQDVIQMPADQWELIQDLDINIFYDDGTGYVDLGLDNSYELDEDGNPIAPSDRTWISIDGQVVHYQRIDTQGDSNDYAIMGRVPVMLNDVRADLILIFDSGNEDGYVAGATFDYVEGETETIAKNLTEINEGDKIDFLTDFYDYNKQYQDTYYLGEEMVVDKPMSEMHIANVSVGTGDVLVTFKFTDIYGQEYWTPALKY